MNALSLLLHAYASIAASHPEKTAFEIVADIEDLAKRFTTAVKTVETALTNPEAAPQG